MKKTWKEDLEEAARGYVRALREAKRTGEYSEVNRVLGLVEGYVADTLQCPRPSCPTCGARSADAAGYRCGRKGEGFLICAVCRCSFRPRTRWWKRTKVWKKGKLPLRSESGGTRDSRARALRFVVENARSTVPGTKTSLKWAPGPAVYCTDATFERAASFLQELFEHSMRGGDPIDVPDFFPGNKGAVVLKWNLAGYRFHLFFPADSTTDVGCGGRKKWVGPDVRGTVGLGGVVEAFELWQGVRC